MGTLLTGSHHRTTLGLPLAGATALAGCLLNHPPTQAKGTPLNHPPLSNRSSSNKSILPLKHPIAGLLVWTRKYIARSVEGSPTRDLPVKKGPALVLVQPNNIQLAAAQLSRSGAPMMAPSLPDTQEPASMNTASSPVELLCKIHLENTPRTMSRLNRLILRPRLARMLIVSWTLRRRQLPASGRISNLASRSQPTDHSISEDKENPRCTEYLSFCKYSRLGD